MDAAYRSDQKAFGDDLIARVEARIDQVKAELHGDIATLRAELIKWSFVFFVTAALAVIGLR